MYVYKMFNEYFRKMFNENTDYRAYYLVIVSIICIIMFFIFEKILFVFSSTYRRSILRDQVLREMEREKAADKEAEVNIRIDEKESMFLIKR